MASPPLRLEIGQIGPDGRRLHGSINTDIFELPEHDARPIPPLEYDFVARVTGDSVILDGDFLIGFDLSCVRCMERFRHQVELVDHKITIEIENPPILDLTGGIREDILLALPRYPRCDHDAVRIRVCPAKNQFAPENQFRPVADGDRDVAPDSGVWDALDQFGEKRED